MPPSARYNDQTLLDKETKTLMQLAEDERRQRAALVASAWAYYEGNHKPPLKLTAEGVDNNVILNFSAQVINDTVSFLFPAFPEIDIEEPGKSEAQENADPAADWLDQCWESNNDETLLTDIATIGGVAGHIFTRVLPPDPAHPYPRVLFLDPAAVLAYWRIDDRDCVLWYEVRFLAGDGTHRLDFVDLTACGLGTGWAIREYVLRGSRWVHLGDQVWPYVLGPIVEWKHLPNPRSFYGKSELANAALNDAINKVASDIKAILRTHASPKTIGTGMVADAVQATAIDSFWAIESADSKVFNLEMTSDLASSMNFLNTLKTAYLAQARVTQFDNGPDAYRNITNLGIKAAFMKMIAKVETLKRYYGKGIKEISRRFLMFGGYSLDLPLELEWPNPLPMSELEQTQVIQLQRDMSLISKETASNQLGIDYDTETERIQEEGDPALDALARLMNDPSMPQMSSNKGKNAPYYHDKGKG
jgi:hypothetical protein